MINILSRFKKPVEPSAKTSKSVPENWHEEFIELLAAVIRPKVYVELGLYECVVFNKLIPHLHNSYPNDDNYYHYYDIFNYLNTLVYFILYDFP